MSATFDIHPDMDELIAAKREVAQAGDPEAMRAAWNAYGARLGRDRPAGMAVRDTVVPRMAARGGDIPIRIYRPEGADSPSPCVVYLHGGSFFKGSLDSGDTVAWGAAAETGMVVVSVDYRLAPQHPFPAALEDCHAVVSHLAERTGRSVRGPGRAACIVGRQRGRQPGGRDLPRGTGSRRSSHHGSGPQLPLSHRRADVRLVSSLRGITGTSHRQHEHRLGLLSRRPAADGQSSCGAAESREPRRPPAGPCPLRRDRSARRRRPLLRRASRRRGERGRIALRAAHDSRVPACAVLRRRRRGGVRPSLPVPPRKARRP